MLLGVSFALLCMGCGNAGPQGQTIDTVGDNDTPLDTTLSDVTDVTDGEIVPSKDTTTSPDNIQEDSDEPVNDDFGEPCEENPDCDSTYCINTSNGKKCTSTCVEECPAGWSCEEVEQGGSDITFICIPTKTALCASAKMSPRRSST